MICEALPDTGVGGHLVLALVLAVACLVVGALTLVLARSRRSGRIVALSTMVLLGVFLGSVRPVPAQASDSGCTAPDNSLTITQTSTMDGLAPGIAPVPITGLVVNNGPDSTYITAITVEITSVTRAFGAPAGTCDAGDYLLLETRMPVGRTLGPGGATTFAGASIGFRNSSVNQDACQNAVINLLYRTDND